MSRVCASTPRRCIHAGAYYRQVHDVRRYRCMGIRKGSQRSTGNGDPSGQDWKETSGSVSAMCVPHTCMTTLHEKPHPMRVQDHRARDCEAPKRATHRCGKRSDGSARARVSQRRSTFQSLTPCSGAASFRTVLRPPGTCALIIESTWSGNPRGAPLTGGCVYQATRNDRVADAQGGDGL